MDERVTYTSSNEERARRRAQRIAARKRRERARRIRRLQQMAPVLLAAGIVVVLVGIFSILAAVESGNKAPEGCGKALPAAHTLRHVPPEDTEPEDLTVSPVFQPVSTANTARTISDAVVSSYAVVIDVEKAEVLAEKDAYTAISPASMTKILTLLVAAEHITDLDDTFTITREITDYTFANGCSVVGLEVGETLTLRDLFYGTILPSGADAALALAIYVAGSHEAFVELMNEKAEELELSEDAHFANCVGIYDEANVCSVYDMALVLKAAMDNEFCRQVLTTKNYSIPADDFHPEGMDIHNWFLRRIEDYIAAGWEVLGAKTGYVSKAGSCAASFAQDAAGRLYICVTAKAGSSWSAIYDHAALYETYAK